MLFLPTAVTSPTPIGTLISRQGLRAARNHVHNGVDIGAPAGTPFGPIMAGVVAETCVTGGLRCYGYGNAVLVKHANDLYSFYGHMDRIDVVPGQAVWPGMSLGTVGTTFGTPSEPNRRLAVPHIHLEILHEGYPFAGSNYAARYDVMEVFAAGGLAPAADGTFRQVAPFEYHEASVDAALRQARAKGGSKPVEEIADPAMVQDKKSSFVWLLVPALVFGGIMLIAKLAEGRE